MKHFLSFYISILLAAGMNDRLYAQAPVRDQEDAPTHLIRIYEDNDFINDQGVGTDNAYTNGTRIELFFTQKKPSRFFLDRVLPKAGDSSVNVFGWGIMELMYTPNDITDPAYQPDDYPWSSTLTGTHTLYSYNPQKKYAFQTELVFGMLGPAALGEQLQSRMHKIIRYLQPMGWSHQFRNAPMLNINFTGEKQLASWGSHIELIAGGQVFFGTMQNGLAVYPLIRIGNFTPYFQGFLSQYTGPGKHAGSRRRNRLNAYFILKPEGQLVFTNALLQGGLFTSNPNISKGGKKNTIITSQSGLAILANESSQPYHDLQRVVCSVSYGAVVSSGHFGVSFTQNDSKAVMKGLYNHEIGNVSLYYGW